MSEGVTLHYPAAPVSISQNSYGELSGITVKYSTDGSVKTIPCTTVLLSCGAWTPKVFQQLFPDSDLQIQITPLAGHHIVVRSPRLPVPRTQAFDDKVEPKALRSECHAIFSSLPSSMSSFSPEFFSRVTGEIWFGGLNSSTLPLPELATAAQVEDHSIKHLREVARKLLGGPKPDDPDDPDDLEVTREAVCFRPVTPSGKPILSRVKNDDLGRVKNPAQGGVFIAAGHGPWGIALSLGTGKVMAEMIEGMETSADVTRLGY